MAIIEQDINLYENQGALLAPGSNQIISFSNFQDPITGEVSVDDANNDIQWDFGEPATFDGEPATLVATGTATIGVSVAAIPLIGFSGITVTLSSPVQVAVITVDGVQYVRFYNEDGTEADPAALLDALATQLVEDLGPIGALVLGVIGDPLAYVENNALLTFDLNDTDEDGTALIPCFTAGTLIATGRGEVKVEDLKVGDLVLTVDRGLQAIRWVGSKTLSPKDLARSPNLAPIRIEAGALGPDLPHATLTVSPQHRCLVRSKIAERMAGEAEVLVAAKHLLGTPGVSVVPADQPVTYIHLLFDRHELVWSNGAVTESLYLGEQAISSVDAEARDEILTLFPKLAELRPPAARPFLRGRLARKLVERSVSNRKVLVEGAGQRAKVLTGA
jgi:hypothetical protein